MCVRHVHLRTITLRQLSAVPPWITVPPIAVVPLASGSHSSVSFDIRGILGGERIHVFGQKMKPISFISPSNTENLSINLPSAGSELEANAPVVPGFLYVQVLAPVQLASATEYHRVLVLDSLEMMHELNALHLGKGGKRDHGEGKKLQSVLGFFFSVFFSSVPFNFFPRCSLSLVVLKKGGQVRAAVMRVVFFFFSLV